MPLKPPLPIDAILPEIVDSLKRQPNLVIEAPPGAGKTTRVPVALLEQIKGEIVVLEPRRIAARLAARRVASEMGEKLGQSVGYQVRFEEVIGPNTRICFVTEGVLTRRMLSDPNLRGVGAVVLDEFHERHLESDLALALLKRLQATRRDLRIVVMSATLDAAPIARYLGDCPVVRSEGALFEVSINHLPYSPEPLEFQVRSACERLLNEDHDGHILTFLPGVAEIRRATRECESIARRADLIVLPLHGSLSPEEQDRAVSPSPRRKLILATNVAESSVTVEGVSAVIDSGLARYASYSPWSGLPTLQVRRVSKSSAKQRAGRAGRTGPGRVLRLFPEEDYARRQEQDPPEILRGDLSQLCLDLRAMKIGRMHELDWLDVPPEEHVRAAEALLDRLGANGETAMKMARYPLPPRLSRIIVEGLKRGVGREACRVAAVLASGAQMGSNDLLVATEAAHDDHTRRLMEQLRRIAKPVANEKHDEDALLTSVLTGFPDRVARRRRGNQILLSSGGSAEISGQVPTYEFMVAVDAEDRSDKPLPVVRVTARIEPEWLIDLFPDRIKENEFVEWNHKAERVDAVSALLYDELVIQESRSSMPDPERAAQLLAEKVLEAGLEKFIDVDLLEEHQARVDFAGLDQPELPVVLREMFFGLRSFGDAKKALTDLITVLEQKVGARRLEEIAPSRIRLPNGRATKVHYEKDRAPWIASRLQDFFGMKDTPRVGPQRTPLVIQLLAPNQRPVQTTTDLSGFWERLYPQVRRELMRRYPKHSWPEKP